MAWYPDHRASRRLTTASHGHHRDPEREVRLAGEGPSRDIATYHARPVRVSCPSVTHRPSGDRRRLRGLECWVAGVWTRAPTISGACGLTKRSAMLKDVEIPGSSVLLALSLVLGVVAVVIAVRTGAIWAWLIAAAMALGVLAQLLPT